MMLRVTAKTEAVSSVNAQIAHAALRHSRDVGHGSPLSRCGGNYVAGGFRGDGWEPGATL